MVGLVAGEILGREGGALGLAVLLGLDHPRAAA
jgi:hypothetical protein